MNLVNRVFNRRTRSSQVAKDRLQALLAHDRARVTPAQLQRLQREMVSTLSKYLDIDEERARFELRQVGRDVLLDAQIPLRR